MVLSYRKGFAATQTNLLDNMVEFLQKQELVLIKGLVELSVFARASFSFYKIELRFNSSKT
jgi:hypothetical protein